VLDTERPACLEPFRTRDAIENAVHTLIDQLCKRLYGEGLGILSAVLNYCRVDGKSFQLPISTTRPSQRSKLGRRPLISFIL
jgi:protein ImuB